MHLLALGIADHQVNGRTWEHRGNADWFRAPHAIVPSAGEDRHRRSIYTFQKRTAPFAMVTTFDGPTGESCLPRRDVSNSALQALVADEFPDVYSFVLTGLHGVRERHGEIREAL